MITPLLGKERIRLAVYPCGKLGMTCIDLLCKDFEKNDVIMVDDYSVNHDGMITIQSLYEQYGAEPNLRILICTKNFDTYTQVMTKASNLFSDKVIIDVFSFALSVDTSAYADRPNYYEEPRIGTLEMVAREIEMNSIEGAMAEVGVYKGDFAKWMLRFLPNRKMYLFDTFEGFDPRDISERDQNIIEFNKDKPFVDTSVEIALNNIGKFYDVEVRKGYFPETAEEIEEQAFSLVSLDTDLYAPIKAGLVYFWPRLSPGGYIFVHDYTWGRVRDAVQEFCN